MVVKSVGFNSPLIYGSQPNMGIYYHPTGPIESPSDYFRGYDFEKTGIPAVIFGSGAIQTAHTLEERVEVDQVVQAAKAYYAILLEMCG